MLLLLFQQINGITEEKNKGVVMVGATNDINSIDEAIIRHGRVGKKIKIELPCKNIIEKLFEEKFLHYALYKGSLCKNSLYEKNDIIVN
jgi:ATP-dependent 26S proteasome regulatory subunit